MDWQKEFEKIASDNLHGASWLLRQAAEVLRHVPAKQRPLAIKMLPTLQPWMASFYNLSHALQNSDDFEEALDRVFFDEERQREKIVQKAAGMMRGKKILTHSFSSMVYEALLLARDVEVIATRSAPLMEGERMAERLLQKDIRVVVIEDGAAGYVMEDVDMVFFGADGIGDFGLVHKIGSFPIALAAKYCGKPLYALATGSKFWPKGFTLPPQPKKDPTEVSSLPALNYYFDVTPHGYFTALTSS